MTLYLFHYSHSSTLYLTSVVGLYGVVFLQQFLYCYVSQAVSTHVISHFSTILAYLTHCLLVRHSVLVSLRVKLVRIFLRVKCKICCVDDD